MFPYYEEVKKLVTEYLDKQGNSSGLPGILQILERDHIIETGTKIMLGKIGVNTYPGDFIKNFLENRLIETYGKADSVNRQAIGFYCTMYYNLEIDLPTERIK